jgi:hypothetical protein
VRWNLKAYVRPRYARDRPPVLRLACVAPTGSGRSPRESHRTICLTGRIHPRNRICWPLLTGGADRGGPPCGFIGAFRFLSRIGSSFSDRLSDAVAGGRLPHYAQLRHLTCQCSIPGGLAALVPLLTVCRVFVGRLQNGSVFFPGRSAVDFVGCDCRWAHSPPTRRVHELCRFRRGHPCMRSNRLRP